MFKTRFDTFGNDFGNFWNFSIFLIFWNHFKDSTLHGTLGKKIFEKFTPKHVQNVFRHFWERFWAFLEFWKIFDFLKTFRRLDTPWNTEQIIFQKNYPKACSKHVWTNWERFWAFFEFWKFFKNISKTRPCLEHWAKKVSRKNYPKTCSKHVLTLLGTILGIFGIFQFFWFFETISKTRPSMEHWAKKFSKNLPQNTFETFFDTFGNDFAHFWSFEKFLIF